MSLTKISNLYVSNRLGVDGLVETSWFQRSLPSSEAKDHHHHLKAMDTVVNLAERNAFEIISMSPGLDLSGLFGKRKSEKKFSAAEITVDTAVERVSLAAKRVGFRTEIGKGKRRVVMWKGTVVVVAEAVEVSDCVVLGVVRVVEDGAGEFGESQWEEIRNGVGEDDGVTWLSDGV